MKKEVVQLNAENKENREIKNSVFVDLFCEDETAYENDVALYNALHDEPLGEDAEIKIFRVENILYMNFKNDISFGVNNRIFVFGEHQSTINENMPLRSLMYAGRAYESLTSISSRYRKTLLKIPTPEFYTFYNGIDDYPEETVLKLSDAFMDKSNIEDSSIPLELRVKAININTNKGNAILQKCSILREYSEFIETVRKYSIANTDNAVEMAIKECIEKGILKEYLERKGSQVISMLIAEYDYETDIKVQREEAAELAREEGKQEGAREQQKLDQVIIDAKDEELNAKDEELNAKDEELNAKDEELNAKDKELAKYRAFILEHGLNPDTV